MPKAIHGARSSKQLKNANKNIGRVADNDNKQAAEKSLKVREGKTKRWHMEEAREGRRKWFAHLWRTNNARPKNNN